MPYRLQNELSRRERQAMAIVYNRKSASVWDILRDIENPPSYSAVRSVVNILETKGFLKHRREGNRYVYVAAIPQKKAVKAAVEHLMKTHFENSIEKAVTAVIESGDWRITEEEFKRLSDLIKRIRKEAD